MRTIVDLPDEQLGALARLCEEQNISRAEAVRRAVDRLLKENSGRDQDAAFGLWKGRRINASAHVTKLRREWDRP